VDRETAHCSRVSPCVTPNSFTTASGFHATASARRLLNVSQERVTGSVGLKLWKGSLNVTSRKSPFSLYRADLASFTMGRYNPKDAEGFINLFALRLPYAESKKPKVTLRAVIRKR